MGTSCCKYFLFCDLAIADFKLYDFLNIFLYHLFINVFFFSKFCLSMGSYGRFLVSVFQLPSLDFWGA